MAVTLENKQGEKLGLRPIFDYHIILSLCLLIKSNSLRDFVQGQDNSQKLQAAHSQVTGCGYYAQTSGTRVRAGQRLSDHQPFPTPLYAAPRTTPNVDYTDSINEQTNARMGSFGTHWSRCWQWSWLRRSPWHLASPCKRRALEPSIRIVVETA